MMESNTADIARGIRYEPDEQPPHALALGLGFQYAMLAVAGIVVTPAIVVRAAGAGDDYLTWAAFAALAISGVTTVFQALRIGHIGSGYILMMGTSGAFIAVCVTALAEGGPGMLASLVAASALVQGAGLLGIYACALLHERGLRVLCSDPLPARRELAEGFGAVGLDPALDPGERRERVLEVAPDGVDAVLEMSGETPAVAAGMDLVRTGGTYVLVGMVHPDSDLAGITGERIVFKCLTIRGVHNYSPRHLQQGIEFLGRVAGRYPFEELIGPTLPLRDLEEGLALSRQRRWLRVAVAPGLEG